MVSYVLSPFYYFNSYFACQFELIKGTFCNFVVWVKKKSCSINFITKLLAILSMCTD